MNSSNNKWLIETPLSKTRNQGFYIETPLPKDIDRGFYYDLGKGKNWGNDDFLEGFYDPFGEKKKQERKERFAEISANTDNQLWSSQSITDPFLEGFNGTSTEENKWTPDLLKEKTIGILTPQLPFDTNRSLNELQNAFRGSQFEGELIPTVQRLNSSPTITPAINRNPNAKNEFEHAIGDPNNKPVVVQYSNKITPTVRLENGDYAAAQRKAKKEQYEKKIIENSEMNGKSVSKTRKASDVIVNNAEFIKSAAKKYGVNPAILAACIYAEQANNVTITENLEDATQSFLGMDCSVGSGQVRISTAKKVEDAGYMPKTYDSEAISYAFTNPFTGEPVYWSDTYSRDKEIYHKLKDPETNINYVAAYLAMIQNMWSKEYPNISGDTAILATLYNMGENGGERGINTSPNSNPFGDFAKANYSYMQYLLALE